MENTILVVGGGHQGLAMAAHLALNGETVNLWNRSPSNIRKVIDTNYIHCNGVVKGSAEINKASPYIGDIMADLIMVTTPAMAHKDIARLLADYVSNNSVIILNPGRTYGAVEFRRELLAQNCKRMPVIAETQTIVYTCRRDDSNNVNIYAMKKDVLISAESDEHMEAAYGKLPKCLQMYFAKAKSMTFTSLGNVGMILHCAPVLMNIGWIENKKVDFKYYYEGITPSIAGFLEKMDRERLAVARMLGCELETTADWLRRSYRVEGKNLYECIRNNESYKDIYAPKSLKHRYLDDDLPFGLVPLESTARHFGIGTPCVTAVIDVASIITGVDYRSIGRFYTPEN